MMKIIFNRKDYTNSDSLLLTVKNILQNTLDYCVMCLLDYKRRKGKNDSIGK